MNILLVDDDPMVRQTLKFGLEAAGFSVLQACNGRECLEVLKSGVVDVIVTDIVMPEFEGIELITQLRLSGSQIPIIAMTGGSLNPQLGSAVTATDVYLRAARVLGATRTLAKPFKTACLVAEIRACLTTPDATA